MPTHLAALVVMASYAPFARADEVPAPRPEAHPPIRVEAVGGPKQRRVDFYQDGHRLTFAELDANLAADPRSAVHLRRAHALTVAGATLLSTTILSVLAAPVILVTTDSCLPSASNCTSPGDLALTGLGIGTAIEAVAGVASLMAGASARARAIDAYNGEAP